MNLVGHVGNDNCDVAREGAGHVGLLAGCLLV
jgi:hypothetical protein